MADARVDPGRGGGPRTLDAAALRAGLLEIVRTRGYERREEPFVLSSGGTSHDYVDLRRALSGGRELLLAGEAVLAHLDEAGWEFDAIGGMTMGADPLAHVVAVLGARAWFSVRKDERSHGTGRRVEGTALRAGVRCVVVEDTVSTGRSLLGALDVVERTGADVVGALTLLDRGEWAAAALVARGVDYAPLLTYDDLGIASLGGPAAATTA